MKKWYVVLKPDRQTVDVVRIYKNEMSNYRVLDYTGYINKVDANKRALVIFDQLKYIPISYTFKFNIDCLEGTFTKEGL